MERKDTNSGDVVASPDTPPVADAGENLTPAAVPDPVASAPAPEAAAESNGIAEKAGTAETAETAGIAETAETVGRPETAGTAGIAGTAPDAVRRRPRGRTSLIVLAAAVLGVAVGGAVGYGVQADRDPTPLGVLAQEHLAYPAKPADRAPDPLPAAEDHQVKTDGDLTELLLDRPKGAKTDAYAGSGWLDLAEYAAEYDSPDYMFSELAGSDLRRIARQSWLESGDRETKIDLLQYRPGSSLGARDHFVGQMSYLLADDDGEPLKGSLDGRSFILPVHREAGYEPTYEARALAVRGGIVMDIYLYSPEPISKKTIRSLAERQLERL